MPEIRSVRPGDLPALIEVFWRGVHEGAAPRYDADQRHAWLPERPSEIVFADRLDGQDVLVGEVAGVPAGFATCTAAGNLDLLFVAPEARRSGLAAALLTAIENRARAAGLTRLDTRASDMARPFLARHGWQVVAPAPQVRDGICLSATDMHRDL